MDVPIAHVLALSRGVSKKIRGGRKESRKKDYDLKKLRNKFKVAIVNFQDRLSKYL